ncbi:MAG: hypothetical protein PHH08_03525, partial [Candidatus ainarchaeum sp.]|nr:hypothetical protein [Candidatus ainarchaeum sp.]
MDEKPRSAKKLNDSARKRFSQLKADYAGTPHRLMFVPSFRGEITGEMIERVQRSLGYPLSNEVNRKDNAGSARFLEAHNLTLQNAKKANDLRHDIHFGRRSINRDLVDRDLLELAKKTRIGKSSIQQKSLNQKAEARQRAYFAAVEHLKIKIPSAMLGEKTSEVLRLKLFELFKPKQKIAFRGELFNSVPTLYESLARVMSALSRAHMFAGAETALVDIREVRASVSIPRASEKKSPAIIPTAPGTEADRQLCIAEQTTDWQPNSDYSCMLFFSTTGVERH